MLPIECPRCHEKNASDAKYCRNCWMPFTPEEAIKQSEKEKTVSDALSDLVSKDQKALLQNLPQESKLDVLATLLLDLESKGQLDANNLLVPYHVIKVKWPVFFSPLHRKGIIGVISTFCSFSSRLPDGQSQY